MGGGWENRAGSTDCLRHAGMPCWDARHFIGKLLSTTICFGRLGDRGGIFAVPDWILKWQACKTMKSINPCKLFFPLLEKQNLLVRFIFKWHPKEVMNWFIFNDYISEFTSNKIAFESAWIKYINSAHVRLLYPLYINLAHNFKAFQGCFLGANKHPTSK